MQKKAKLLKNAAKKGGEKVLNVLLYYVGHGISHKDHTFAVLPGRNSFFDLTALALNLAGYKNVRVWSFFDCSRSRGDGSYEPPEVDEVISGD